MPSRGNARALRGREDVDAYIRPPVRGHLHPRAEHAGIAFISCRDLTFNIIQMQITLGPLYLDDKSRRDGHRRETDGRGVVTTADTRTFTTAIRMGMACLPPTNSRPVVARRYLDHHHKNSNTSSRFKEGFVVTVGQNMAGAKYAHMSRRRRMLGRGGADPSAARRCLHCPCAKR